MDAAKPKIKFFARAMKKIVEPDGTITIEAVDPSLVKPAPEHLASFLAGQCGVTTDDLGAFQCAKRTCTGLCGGPFEDENGNNYCTCL